MERLRICPGLIDQLKRDLNLQTDDQLATALNETRKNLDELRRGTPASWITIMRIAGIRGRPYDARGIVEPIKD